MTDRRTIRHMQDIGCSRIRETRHGEIWRLPNNQTIMLSSERNWGDPRTARNAMAELRRKMATHALAR